MLHHNEKLKEGTAVTQASGAMVVKARWSLLRALKPKSETVAVAHAHDSFLNSITIVSMYYLPFNYLSKHPTHLSPRMQLDYPITHLIHSLYFVQVSGLVQSRDHRPFRCLNLKNSSNSAQSCRDHMK